MGIISMTFSKKILFETNGLFRNHNSMCSQLCQDCFTILHNEKGEDRHVSLEKKSYLGQFGHFSGKMVHPSNFVFALRLFCF